MSETLPAQDDEISPIFTGIPPILEDNQSFPLPTPDARRDPPVIRTDTVFHTVQPGESLGYIASLYNVSIYQISDANHIPNPDLLAIGQVLVIPAPILQAAGPGWKIIPDSELVYGPGSVQFDLFKEVDRWGGKLSSYSQEIEDREMSGAEIVQTVAQDYSINPRLLLALLEYQSNWLTHPEGLPERSVYPMGYQRADSEGLFNQLSWAADQINTGYYRWRAGWVGPYVFDDGSVVVPGVGVNAGTVGVQYLFSQLYPVDTWRDVIGEAGFYQTILYLFGNPFERAVEPLIEPGLEQPLLQLPFEQGSIWSFTGGPHSAWGDGAGWAALDFAPPGYAYGCVLTNEWVVAAVDGLVVRSGGGQVIQDLDGDGYEQTGWVLLYMHVEERDRAQAGSFIHAGDRIGHPSCAGGVSTGTHLHIARKYNGEWIPADGMLPFVMDGWVSSGYGNMYEGSLTRDSSIVDSCACRSSFNQISR